MVGKFKSAWAITPSKIVKSKFQNHMHIFISWEQVYKISNESDERCRRSCGDKIFRTVVAKFKSAWAITPSKTVELKFQNHMYIFIS